jgi:hypothetical protein
MYEDFESEHDANEPHQRCCSYVTHGATFGAESGAFLNLQAVSLLHCATVLYHTFHVLGSQLGLRRGNSDFTLCWPSW